MAATKKIIKRMMLEHPLIILATKFTSDECRVRLSLRLSKIRYVVGHVATMSHSECTPSGIHAKENGGGVRERSHSTKITKRKIFQNNRHIHSLQKAKKIPSGILQPSIRVYNQDLKNPICKENHQSRTHMDLTPPQKLGPVGDCSTPSPKN